jgi:hypothetical protein
MKFRDALKLSISVSAVLALAILVQPASASVVGHLDFGQCAGDDVRVSLTTIDWLPAGTGTGCIAAGAAMSVTFSGAPGAISPADLGTLNDLTVPPAPGQNVGFITFPGVTFDLATIGPLGPTPVCSAVVTSNCVIAAGSPFLLTQQGTSTNISLNVAGLANDSTSSNSVWSGFFTTQLANTSIAAISSTLNSGGSILTSFSFNGDVTAGSTGTPEPVSMALIGGGLIALASLKRRKSRT